MIHPTAIIDPKAELHETVFVGPYTVIGSGVRVDAGCEIGPYAHLVGETKLGKNNRIHAGAVIGDAPQDLKYTGEESALVIGNDNVVREFVTINIGTAAGSWVTSLGDNNLIMACAHVAHDCVIEDKVIIGNNVLLAGHVRIENNAIISGGAAVNHYVTIGKQAMVGGMSRVVKDVPPFMTIEGSPARVRGVNVIGLKRSETPTETVRQLRAAFRKLFQDDTPSALVLDEIEAVESLTPEVLRLVSFLRDMEKGYQGRYREALRRPPQADE